MGLTATRIRRLVPLAGALAAFKAAPALAQAQLPHGLGLVDHPAAAACGPAAFTAHSQRLASLPANVDLTRWAVPPGDQGNVGSCTTWAVAYTTMGYWETRQGISTPRRL